MKPNPEKDPLEDVKSGLCADHDLLSDIGLLGNKHFLDHQYSKKFVKLLHSSLKWYSEIAAIVVKAYLLT